MSKLFTHDHKEYAQLIITVENFFFFFITIRYAVASWSSGTGGAGLVGSFAYAGMTEGGLSPEVALLTSISVPILMAISYVIFKK